MGTSHDHNPPQPFTRTASPRAWTSSSPTCASRSTRPSAASAAAGWGGRRRRRPAGGRPGRSFRRSIPGSSGPAWCGAILSMSCCIRVSLAPSFPFLKKKVITPPVVIIIHIADAGRPRDPPQQQAALRRQRLEHLRAAGLWGGGGLLDRRHRPHRAHDRPGRDPGCAPYGMPCTGSFRSS